MTGQITEIIETIGTIEKKEIIESINFDDLVLESLHPFPGYHGTTIPDNTNPKSIFLILRTKYTDEEIVRATQKIKEKLSMNFDASPGTITVFNKTEACIRLKGLDNYTFIPEIIEKYKDVGLNFQKRKTIKEYEGIIRIKKYFILSELNDGIYMDKETPEMGYFEIPVQLKWDDFEKMTIELKHNIEENNFDVAMGTIYRKSGLKDIIRIFDTNVCLGECLFLREKYMNAIEKHLKK
jgi:hypothetical protein